MRFAAAALLLLLVAASVVAGDEEDLLEFTGLCDMDADDLRHAGREDLEEVCELLRTGAPEDEVLAYAEDAAFEMAIFLRREGYPLARIEPVAIPGRIRFDVAPGPRTFFGEVTVAGVDEAEAEILGSYVDPPRTWLLGSRLFVPGNLAGAARKMEGYLRQRGYADAVVTMVPPAELVAAEGAPPPGEMTLDVVFEVEKGALHLLESVHFSGNTVTTADDLLDRQSGPDRKTIRGIIGKPFGPFTPFDVRAMVAEDYGERGYPFVEVLENVTLETRGETTAALLSIDIREGPRTDIRSINIHGNHRTKDHVIRRELGLFPGDRYEIVAAAEAQRHLIETGLFRQVFVDMVRPEEGVGGDTAEADLTVTVEENEFRRLETMVGWGTWELLRGAVSMTWRNMWGEAYEGTVALSASVRGFRLGGHLKDPWFLPDLLWDRTAFIAEGYVELQERPTFTYSREEFGLILRKRDWDLLPDTVTSLGYSYSFTDVFQVSDELPEEFENTTNIGSLTLSATRDTRNNPWSPSSGSAVGGSLQYANQGLLGGDLDFWRGRLSGVKYLDLGSGFVLAGRVMVGAIIPFGQTEEIPIQERFYLGGGQTVRSFEQDDLGPRAIGDDGRPSDSASGGEFFSLVNLELRAALPFGSLEGVLFADGGNVIRKVGDAGLADYRFAVGAGLRLPTPIGPLRLDFGVNPNPRSYEESWMLYFAVGYPF